MRILFTLMLVGCILKVNAQNKYSGIGKVTDKAGAPLISATAVLLNPTDSTLAKYGITNREGHFKIPNIKAGQYLLQVSFLGYQNYFKNLDVSGNNPQMDFGTIGLEEENATLNEVVIEGESVPILIKKDTIEYNASSFKTQQNAVVEELLKQLPGVEVEEDGTIKAQGKEVNKVLVDGKEFFGDDPKIATKNLPADAVDKVQVFDKKSDQAEFTGIDDGQRDKTINLALKDDHKNGTFGTLMAGYGSDELYDSKLNLNRFNKATQLSLIGSFNNINKQSFSITDYINMSGGLAGMIANGGGRMEIRIEDGAGSPLAADYGNGFITSGSIGLNASHDFSKKSSLTASYFFNDMKNELDQFTQRQNFLPGDAFYFENNNLDQVIENQNHRLNLNFKYNIDSTQKLKIRSSIGYNKTNLYSLSDNEVLNSDGLLENSANRENNADGDAINGNIRLTYLKKLNKPGRNFSIGLNGGINERDNQSRLKALNTFYQGIDNPLIQEILQDQSQVDDQYNYDASLTFTEPLGKRYYLSLTAEQSDYNNTLNQEVYDLIPLEKFNEELSNQYKRNYIYQKAGFSFKRNRKKSTLSLGGKVQRSSLNGTINNTEDRLEEVFTNFLPNLFFNYDLSQAKHIFIRYNTDINAPSLEQLQPIVDNSDPLRIYIGNPALRPEYKHSGSVNFSSYSQFSRVSLFANVRGSIVENKITNSRTIDEQFRETTKPINTNNGIEVSGNASFGAPLKFINGRVRISTGAFYLQETVFINDSENQSKNLTNSIKFKLDNKNKENIDLSFGIELRRNKVKYSLQEELNRTYHNQVFYANATVYPHQNLALRQSLRYKIYDGASLQEQQDIPIWNASVSYFIDHGRLELKISATDLLNKNLGINQSGSANYLEYRQSNTIGRYFMFSITYALKKFGQKNNDIIIERI